MLEYKTIDNFKPGLIKRLLKNCYKGLIEHFPEEKQRFYRQWEKEDNETFNNPKTVGKYVLFSCINNSPIGYVSWDDRQFPLGIVGQNCILPDYQGKGYGKKQIELIIKFFQDNKFNEIQAITGDHEFFAPARRIYITCGFQELKKTKGDIFELVEFFKLIK
ncbi:MAG: GNAT family N-acetyltransferase [Bacteroidales bacterium]|nr:GNAT family N-acetyltransferase [Bacteroidales bacterium]